MPGERALNCEIGTYFSIGTAQPLTIIAGPCQIETLEHCLMIAEFVKELCARHGFNYIFKASYDKANRTSAASKRGPGVQEGLKILRAVKDKLSIPVLSDVHSPNEAEQAGQVLDVLQIPAFLCRQTDLLAAAGAANKAVNIKKGQFLPPEDMKYCAEKVAFTGNRNILLCERGSCFGYRDLVVDMRSLIIMRQCGYPVIFDAGHSVQNVGGAGGATSGNRAFIRPLARAAVAAGIDGLFVECHDNPDAAPSDGPNMLNLAEMEKLLLEVKELRSAAQRMER